MSTDYIDNINDNKFFNVMLQKDIVTGSAEVTQSYSLFVGRKDSDATRCSTYFHVNIKCNC